MTGATFESMLNLLYRRTTLIDERMDEELCEHCCGFGSVRCPVCLGSGTILNRARMQRLCPLCAGRKRERCKRCAGRGTTGMKRRTM